mgnify:CR=1 FL=1
MIGLGNAGEAEPGVGIDGDIADRADDDAGPRHGVGLEPLAKAEGGLADDGTRVHARGAGKRRDGPGGTGVVLWKRAAASEGGEQQDRGGRGKGNN